MKNVNKLKGFGGGELIAFAFFVSIATIAGSIIQSQTNQQDKRQAELNTLSFTHFDEAKQNIDLSSDVYVARAIVYKIHDCTINEINTYDITQNNKVRPSDAVRTTEKDCSTGLINKVALNQNGQVASAISKEIQRLGYPVDEISEKSISSNDVSLSSVNIASLK